MAKTTATGGRTPPEQGGSRASGDAEISFLRVPPLAAACENDQKFTITIQKGFRKVARPVPPGVAEPQATQQRLANEAAAKRAAIELLLDRIQSTLSGADRPFLCDRDCTQAGHSCYVAFTPEPETLIVERTLIRWDGAAGKFNRFRAFELRDGARIEARCACAEFA